MPSRDPRKPTGPAKAPPLDVPPFLVPLVALKLFLAFGLLFVALRMELPQFQGKAMWERLVAYPLLAAAIPLAWWLLRRRSRDPGPYPFAADAMFTLGLILDVLGNIFDLFDTVAVYDDLMHLVNWGLYSAAFGSLLLRTNLGPWPLFGLVTGFGAITAILWEGLEWLGFIRFGTELETAYFDTLLDQHLGLLGSAVAGVVVARIAARKRDAGPA